MTAITKPLFRGKQLRVRVLRRHFNLATDNGKLSLDYAFGDIHGCPIAQALKELFPNVYVNVSPWNVYLNGKSYELTGGRYTDIAKNKPMTVTLTKEL